MCLTISFSGDLPIKREKFPLAFIYLFPKVALLKAIVFHRRHGFQKQDVPKWESRKMHPLETAEVALQREPNHTVSGSSPISTKSLWHRQVAGYLMPLIKSPDESK